MPARSARWEGVISIHALRGEGDVNIVGDVQGITAFQSTPSVGRATVICG